VAVDAALFSLKGMKAEDILDHKPVTVDGQTVTLDVAGKDFRLVLLKKQEAP